MTDKCSNRLKFHFIRNLTKKKLCPYAIENLHPALHSKMAPEPLFACQILRNNRLTWRTIPHSDDGLIRVIGLKLPYSEHALNLKKITQSIKPCNWLKKTSRWQTSMKTMSFLRREGAVATTSFLATRHIQRRQEGHTFAYLANSCCKLCTSRLHFCTFGSLARPDLSTTRTNHGGVGSWIMNNGIK